MNSFSRRIGFMQGRLSPLVNGKIQAFPWESWRQEFPQAKEAGFTLMEWTLDDEGLLENPFNTAEGQKEIRNLFTEYGVRVKSVTCDNFMQAPFFKAEGNERLRLIDRNSQVIDSALEVGVEIVVLPLVDQSSVTTEAEEATLKEWMLKLEHKLESGNIKIAFETDYSPEATVKFIRDLPARSFGINYDIGNSASLGYDPEKELRAYGNRVLHVHVKDRELKGTTVPLGNGNADFSTVFSELKALDYRGDFILQTARAKDENHLGVLKTYRDFTLGQIGNKWNSN